MWPSRKKWATEGGRGFEIYSLVPLLGLSSLPHLPRYELAAMKLLAFFTSLP